MCHTGRKEKKSIFTKQRTNGFPPNLLRSEDSTAKNNKEQELEKRTAVSLHFYPYRNPLFLGF